MFILILGYCTFTRGREFRYYDTFEEAKEAGEYARQQWNEANKNYPIWFKICTTVYDSESTKSK